MVVDNGLPDISASRATPSPTPAYPQVASSLPKHSSRTGSNITRLPPLQSSAEDDLLERERQLEDNLQQIEERMSLREQAWRLKKEGNEKAAQHAKYELDIRTTKKARWSVDSKGKLVREEGRAAPRYSAVARRRVQGTGCGIQVRVVGCGIQPRCGSRVWVAPSGLS